MPLTQRRYQNEEDYWRLRAFLREVFLLNERWGRSWQAFRFDYWRWHVNGNIVEDPLEEIIFIWEAAEGQIAAVLHPEDKGSAFLQVHPAYRSPGLVEEMVATAEQHLGIEEGGKRELYFWRLLEDTLLEGILLARGYAQNGTPEYQRRRSLSLPIPDVRLPEGYRIRPLGDVGELPQRSWLSWRAFHPDEPDERYGGWEWYLNIQRAPLYRRDLDLVAVAPDGELASFCSVWFDDVTRTAAFEPVGTDPAHRRRGLAQALLYEGMRRAQHLGATLATVGSYSQRAHELYASAGFTEYDISEPWGKELEG